MKHDLNTYIPVISEGFSLLPEHGRAAFLADCDALRDWMIARLKSHFDNLEHNAARIIATALIGHMLG